MATFMLSKGLRLQKRDIFSRLGCVQQHLRYQSAKAQESVAIRDEVAEGESLYPAIKPRLPPGEWGDITRKHAWQIHEWAEESLSHQTAKERLEKLAGETDTPQFRVVPFDKVPNTLDFKQYITNTHWDKRALPHQVYMKDVSAETLTAVKNIISDTVLEEQEFLHKHKLTTCNSIKGDVQSDLDHDFIGQVLQRMVALLAPQSPHLTMCQIDEHGRLEASWKRYGFDREDIRLHPSEKKMGMTPFQLTSQLNWQLRGELPLPNMIDPEDEVCKSGFVPQEILAPYVAGAYKTISKPTNFAGYRLGDPCEFPALSVLCRDPQKLQNTRMYRDGEKATVEEQEHDIAAALAVGFGATVAAAHNQGFNWLLDLTYPLCTQLLMTEGRALRVGMYQLNTLRMWTQVDMPTKNMFWVTQLMPLYEKVEDGKVLGLNDELITYLCQMVMLEPVDDGKDLRPHLPNDTRSRPGERYPYLNTKGQPPLDVHKLGRFEVPRNSVYSY